MSAWNSSSTHHRQTHWPGYGFTKLPGQAEAKSAKLTNEGSRDNNGNDGRPYGHMGFTKFTRSDAHGVIAMTYRNSSNPDLAIANPAANFEEL